jgi:hypothetical protein
MHRTATPPAAHPGKELVRRLVDEVVNARGSGTHLGEWLGQPATGRRFEHVDEIYIFTVSAGRLLAAVAIEDNLARARQLGMRIGADPTDHEPRSTENS